MKLITVNQYWVHMTPMTLKRSLSQRSRSSSNGHLVNSTALRKHWMDLNQKLHIYFLQSRQEHELTIFQGHGFKGQGHRNYSGGGIPVDGSLSTSI